MLNHSFPEKVDAGLHKLNFLNMCVSEALFWGPLLPIWIILSKFEHIGNWPTMGGFIVFARMV